MTRVLLALGANVGQALDNLLAASEELSRHLVGTKASHVYRTAPMYVTDQPEFLNAAVSGRTELGPLPLLQLLKSIERELGRGERSRFGPREIDIDLIAYGSARYVYRNGDKEMLRIPHPRVSERRFVLQPLSDIAPEAVLPGLGRVCDLLAKTIEQESDVVRLDNAVLPVHGP